jgi:putative zinc finger protein
MTAQTLAFPCKEQEENLVLFHYGELLGAERDDLRGHLQSCPLCTAYLKDLAALLPLTIAAEQPPEIFWIDYNRELRHKLDGLAEKKNWRHQLADFFQPRWLPAFAAAAVVALALMLTLGKGIWPKNDPSQEDAAILELLPVAENLEFFKSMEVLDDLDLLESMGSQGNAA